MLYDVEVPPEFNLLYDLQKIINPITVDLKSDLLGYLEINPTMMHDFYQRIIVYEFCTFLQYHPLKIDMIVGVCEDLLDKYPESKLFRDSLLELGINHYSILILKLYKAGFYTLTEIIPALNVKHFVTSAIVFSCVIDDIYGLCANYYDFKDKSEKLKDLSLLTKSDITVLCEQGWLFGTLGHVLKYDEVEEMKSLVVMPGFSYSNELKSEFEQSKVTLSMKPLSMAAFFGSIKCFKIALVEGAQLEKSVYQSAFFGGCYEIVRLIDLSIPEANYLTYASQGKNHDILNWMLESNDFDFGSIMKDTISGNDMVFITFLLSKGVIPDMKDGIYRNPLCEAASNQNIPLIKYFLRTGADVNIRNSGLIQ